MSCFIARRSENSNKMTDIPFPESGIKKRKELAATAFRTLRQKKILIFAGKDQMDEI